MYLLSLGHLANPPAPTMQLWRTLCNLRHACQQSLLSPVASPVTCACTLTLLHARHNAHGASRRDIAHSGCSLHERAFDFQVMKCPKRYVHDWRSCPFAHPTENARRRDPREVKYMPVPCPDYKRGLCLMVRPTSYLDMSRMLHVASWT